MDKALLTVMLDMSCWLHTELETCRTDVLEMLLLTRMLEDTGTRASNLTLLDKLAPPKPSIIIIMSSQLVVTADPVTRLGLTKGFPLHTPCSYQGNSLRLLFPVRFVSKITQRYFGDESASYS